VGPAAGLQAAVNEFSEQYPIERVHVADAANHEHRSRYGVPDGIRRVLSGRLQEALTDDVQTERIR